LYRVRQIEMLPKGILQTIIKLRHMSGDEVKIYFEERAKANRNKKDWTALQHATDQEKWHGLKNNKTYSRHFD